MYRIITRYTLALWLTVLPALLPMTARADDESKEQLVKAAFIYNFVKFVEWPDGKAISHQSNIDICTLGDNSLKDAAQVFHAASSDKLTLSLVEERNLRNAAAHCHIVFIGVSQEGILPDALAVLKGQPVLTVSDIPNFAEAGGMIGFVMNDNKIKIAVNAKAATTAKLRIDAQLLEIALKVIDK